MSEVAFRARWGQISSLFCAHFLSLVGNGLSAIAIPWFVYDLTGNAVLTASIAVAGQLPNIVTGLFSGPIIDRFSARNTSLFCDALNALAVLLIPLLYSVDLLDLAVLGVLVFLSQVIDVPGQTAKSVLIPALIDREQLPRERVNGMNSLLETVADLLTPSLAGILIASLGATSVLLLDSASFLLAMIFVGLGVKVGSKPKQQKSTVKQTKDIWKWMLTAPSILKLGVYDLIINTVAVSLLSLTLPVLANMQDKQAVWLGIWLTSFACGTTLTTLAYTLVGHRLSSQRLLQFTPVGQGIGLALVGVALYFSSASVVYGSSGFLITFGMFVYGVNLGVGSVVDATVLQRLVSEEKRGTVFSAFSSIRYSGVPLGLLISGVLLETNSIALLFSLFVLMLLGSALLWAKGAKLP